MADYSSDISFDCPSCSEQVSLTVGVPEPNWTGDTAEERIVEDEIDIICPECRTVFTANALNSDNAVTITLIEHRDTKVEAGLGYDASPDFDEDYWYDVPRKPFDIFCEVMSEGHDILASIGRDNAKAAANRMVLVHYFGALESYLSDTLLNAIQNDSDALKALVANDLTLKETKLPLTQILKDPDCVKRTATEHLRGLSFHNFSHVAAIYKVALGVNLFPVDGMKVAMMRSLPVRHDCVHRNGRTKDGELRTDITKSNVGLLAAHMIDMAKGIEGQMTTRAKLAASRIDFGL